MTKKKKTEETKAKKLEDLRLEELEDIPLVGGIFRGLGKLIDLAERVEEAGGKIEKRGEIKGLTPRHPRAVWGFTVSTLSKDRKPGFKIEPFGNIHPVRKSSISNGVKETKKAFEISEEREPIVDVFDEKDEILVIAELPGIDEKEIRLDLKEDILLLEASDKERKYKKEILLPAKVEMESKKMSFKNGILEVRFKKI